MATSSHYLDNTVCSEFVNTTPPDLHKHEQYPGSIAGASHSGSESEATSQSDDNAPEALVRNENRAVKVIRIFAVFILISVTVATSYLIYLFAHDSQVVSFEDSFAAVASKLSTAMVTDLSVKVWTAHTLSKSISILLRSTNSTPASLSLDQEDWELLSREARVYGNINYASWNPLLRTDEERIEFEKFAQTHQFKSGTEPVCYVCGSEDRGYSNPDDVVELTGLGKYQCGVLEKIGRQGIIPAENCPLLGVVASSVCECANLTTGTEVVDNMVDIPERLFRFNEITGEVEEVPYFNPPYLATWTSAVVDVLQFPVMYNQISEPLWSDDIETMLNISYPILSQIFMRTGSYYEDYVGYPNEAGSILQYPVISNEEIMGSISLDIRWSTFVSSVFPPQSQFVEIVVENSCGGNHTFTINEAENNLILKGQGDLHNPLFSSKAVSSTFEHYKNVIQSVVASESPDGYCQYRFHVFPTQEYEDYYLDSEPIIIACVTASIFIFTSIVFFVYDATVARRQRKVMDSATRTNAIVSSLFPKNVRDRLFEQAGGNGDMNDTALRVSKLKMHSFLKGENKESLISTEPIADLFASATVMFLDIAGFTAWSSEREPTQVFQLLESVYQAFDDIAKKLSVFKVETIGDSYVAVCGLPTRREGHAPIMVQFAAKCLKAMQRVTRSLEVILGPSTGDLEARVGLHSGPVTAGVLRGEKARFQLFGDTVNTASRIENSGKPGRIHASKATVDLLMEAGKSHWVEKREDKVSIKGKGELQTYWLLIDSTTRTVNSESDRSSQSENNTVSKEFVYRERSGPQVRDVVSRLIDWNVEVIYAHLERVVANRRLLMAGESQIGVGRLLGIEEAILENSVQGMVVIDEMSEMLSLAEFNGGTHVDRHHAGSSIDPKVKVQLREYVSSIASLYRDVPFHNFEHVSHVVMSASKIMNRIINPDDIDYRQNSKQVAKDIHKSTFGFSSDPILQFAVVFSALIHDADHTGLTNVELNTMGTSESIKYRQQSVAEQNSVDIAWKMLMESRYRDLRACIYSNEDELRHFRQCIVNAVMATDIADKRLKEYREGRWDLAFPKDNSESKSHSNPALFESTEKSDTNRKATIVYEYIIQASDVAHTMQHWHTYQKFNRRLFEERYLAWLNGHAEKEPSLGWYGGELWFFDNYIIPLAEKLNKCGVFGVSYDEYLTYAIENRKEWELKGKDIVEEMRWDCERKHGKERVGKADAEE